MISREKKTRFYERISSVSTGKSNKWLLIIFLSLNLNVAFAQFNSVVRKEEVIEISLKTPTPPNIKGPPVKQLPQTTDLPEDVEDLKHAPKPVDLQNLDKAEAIVFSNMGAHLPIDSIILRSGYGWRTHPITKKWTFHPGIDLSARKANIYAVLHGSVNSTGYNSIIGNYIRLTHGNYTTVYGHLSEIYVKPGELVKAGEVIGLSGATGRATGEHLHFTVKYKGNLIEPLMFLTTILRSKPTDLYIALFK